MSATAVVSGRDEFTNHPRNAAVADLGAAQALDEGDQESIAIGNHDIRERLRDRVRLGAR
jgi:hypothetical protein